MFKALLKLVPRQRKKNKNGYRKNNNLLCLLLLFTVLSALPLPWRSSSRLPYTLVLHNVLLTHRQSTAHVFAYMVCENSTNSFLSMVADAAGSVDL